MKNLLYSLYSKWSLFLAIFPHLWFFKNALRENFPDLWQYRLELPCGDYVKFFPYIVSVKNKKKTVKDPVNIAAYGVSPNEFIHLLRRASPRWRQFLGSSYFLYGSSDHNWHSSIAIKADIDKASGERHHIRLFGLKTALGEKVTLGAAHHDWPHHAEEEPPVSWNETRDIVARNFIDSGLGIISGLSEKVTASNWRGTFGDGKILIIKIQKGTA